MAAQAITGSIWEDSGCYMMAYTLANDGTVVVQADITSIAYTIYDLTDTTSATASGALTVSEVIYDTLQTDARWTLDSTGYNFGWAAAASLFPSGDAVYHVEVRATPAAGEAYMLGVYRIHSRDRFAG